MGYGSTLLTYVYVITACSHPSSDTPGRLNQNVNDYRGFLMSGVIFIIIGVSAEYSVTCTHLVVRTSMIEGIISGGYIKIQGIACILCTHYTNASFTN